MDDYEFSSLLLPLSVEDVQRGGRMLSFSSECPKLSDDSECFLSESFWKDKFSPHFKYNDAAKAIEEQYSDDWITQNNIERNANWRYFLKGLKNVLSFQKLTNIFSQKDVSVSDILNNHNDETKRAFSKIIRIILKVEKKSSSKSKLLLFLANFFLPPQFFTAYSKKSDLIYLCSSVKISRGIFRSYEDGWAILSPANHLTVIQDSEEKIVFDEDINELCVSSGKIKAANKKKEVVFKCTVETATSLWENYKEQKALFFDSFNCINKGNYPQILAFAIRTSLFSDDLLMLQAILSLQMDKLEKWDCILDALITLSISSKRIDALLSYITCYEISQTTDEKVILRSDSICTHLFRVYYSRYAGDYISLIIRPLFDIILNTELKSIKDEDVDIEVVRVHIFATINAILSSFPYIPQELRHLALHVYNAAYCFFGTPEAIFNSLTSFFALRFLMPFFVAPELVGENNIEFELVKNILTPFGTIMLNIFSCNGIPKNFPHMKCLEQDYLENKPKYQRFFLSLPLRTFESVNYGFPRNDEVDDAVNVIINTIIEHKEDFLMNYNKLMNDPERVHPLAYRMQTILCTCFNHDRDC